MSDLLILDGEWSGYEPGTAYSCAVHLFREEDGAFSAVVARLPGCASQGCTEAEALANVTEALAACIEAYWDAGEDVPWAEARELDWGWREKVVLVRVGGKLP